MEVMMKLCSRHTVDLIMRHRVIFYQMTRTNLLIKIAMTLAFRLAMISCACTFIYCDLLFRSKFNSI